MCGVEVINFNAFKKSSVCLGEELLEKRWGAASG